MKCKCGCEEFIAHQLCYLDVIVDSKGNFLYNYGENAEASIYQAEDPCGPYTCVKCGEEYSYLED